ncbi:hypothetical protein [Streptomyces sp. NBC_01618]|uniref:hypothetical protein n=1 Tax=Streptomyces sp. NBC_01618 TaxID=2975900 RepID=UPI003866AD80|nr:hypothetical protein OH735_32800 [Streptomyces sp. NBC_01618]
MAEALLGVLPAQLPVGPFGAAHGREGEGRGVGDLLGVALVRGEGRGEEPYAEPFQERVDGVERGPVAEPGQEQVGVVAEQGEGVLGGAGEFPARVGEPARGDRGLTAGARGEAHQAGDAFGDGGAGGVRGAQRQPDTGDPLDVVPQFGGGEPRAALSPPQDRGPGASARDDTEGGGGGGYGRRGFGGGGPGQYGCTGEARGSGEESPSSQRAHGAQVAGCVSVVRGARVVHVWSAFPAVAYRSAR